MFRAGCGCGSQDYIAPVTTGFDYTTPVTPGFGYTAPVTTGYGAGHSFTLIVVLFILLIIVGAAWA